VGFISPLALAVYHRNHILSTTVGYPGQWKYMSQHFAAQCSLEQILILMLKEEFLAGFKIKRTEHAFSLTSRNFQAVRECFFKSNATLRVLFISPSTLAVNHRNRISF
jgi:hypothetical protein